MKNKIVNCKKVSVIIPFFNAQLTLKKCINSILKQDYFNLEIILIDDSSTDASQKICIKFLKKYPEYIKYKRTFSNSGVSSARNIGIQISSGYYLLFLDSDDWLPKKSISTLVDTMEKRQSDYVVGGLKQIKPYFNRTEKMDELDIYLNSKSNISFFSNGIYYCAVAKKLLKTNIIKQNNILFDESVSYGEDQIFMLSYLSNCKNATSINKTVYVYSRLFDGGSVKFWPQKNEWEIKPIIAYKNCLNHFISDLSIVNQLVTNSTISRIYLDTKYYLFHKGFASKEDIINTFDLLNPFVSEQLVDYYDKAYKKDLYLYIKKYREDIDLNYLMRICNISKRSFCPFKLVTYVLKNIKKIIYYFF